MLHKSPFNKIHHNSSNLGTILTINLLSARLAGGLRDPGLWETPLIMSGRFEENKENKRLIQKDRS